MRFGDIYMSTNRSQKRERWEQRLTEVLAQGENAKEVKQLQCNFYRCENCAIGPQSIDMVATLLSA